MHLRLILLLVSKVVTTLLVGIWERFASFQHLSIFLFIFVCYFCPSPVGFRVRSFAFRIPVGGLQHLLELCIALLPSILCRFDLREVTPLLLLFKCLGVGRSFVFQNCQFEYHFRFFDLDLLV